MASIDIASEWADSLERYFEGLVVEAVHTAEQATQAFHAAVQDRARGDEQWTTLADDISIWSEDGQLVIGFANPELANEASLIEYGHDGESPNPLFRTLTAETRMVNDGMQNRMDARYGPSMTSGAPKIRGMRYGH